MPRKRSQKVIPSFESRLEQSEYYRSKVLNYIGFKMRTRQEVVRYLMSHECPEDLCEEILTFLESYQFVDDEQYTRNYIIQSRQLQHWSRRDITYRLQQKGISSECIQKIFEEDAEDQEEQEARKTLEKKLRSTPNPDSQKIAAFMMRRGFSYELVRRLLRESLEIE